MNETHRDGSGPRWQHVGPPGQRGRCLSLGAGPDLALLVSPLATAECYLPTAQRLAARGRAHLIEMPGSGRSERLPAPWSLRDYADWAAAVMAERGLERPAVFGHSYAGLVAVDLAARYPERCGALVVADTPAPGAPASLWRGLAGAVVDVVLDLPIVLANWHHVAGNALTHTRNYFALLRESLRADVTGLARQVQVPALVVWGARDHTLPPRGAELYAGCLPGARAYLSRKGTHTWVVSQPEELARVVAAFLASAAPARS
jgi:pimeloyl-ACP methyl ester carboxylesterase